MSSSQDQQAPQTHQEPRQQRPFTPTKRSKELQRRNLITAALLLLFITTLIVMSAMPLLKRIH